METAVCNVKPGKIVRYHGKECIVLEHQMDCTLLMDLDGIETRFGHSNNFANSSLYKNLNGPYLDSLTDKLYEIINRTVDLTAINGSKEYRVCVCKVAPLTIDEIRKYRYIIPKAKTWEWSVTSRSTPIVDKDNIFVLGVHSDFNIGNSDCFSYGICRPAFLVFLGCNVEVEDNLPDSSCDNYGAKMDR